MRKNPERLAWLVLLISFALCGLVATVVPVSARRFLDDHTSVRPARLDIIYGTVLVQRVGVNRWQLAHDGAVGKWSLRSVWQSRQRVRSGCFCPCSVWQRLHWACCATVCSP